MAGDKILGGVFSNGLPMMYIDIFGDGTAYAIATKVMPPSYAYRNLTANATTVVKSGAGLLKGIFVNSLGTGTASITVYDNTAASGTKIATINAALLIGPFEYEATFTTGLTVVVASLLPPDITVIYS